jgi:hypothetical protein
LQKHQFICTFLFCFFGYTVFIGTGSPGVIFFGIGEYTEPVKPNLFDKLPEYFKFLFGFSRMTGHDCSPQGYFRYLVTDKVDQFMVLPLVMTPAHFFKHCITIVLKRYIKIPANIFSFFHNLDHFTGETCRIGIM